MFARAFSRFASLAAPAPQRGWNAFVLPSRHFATAAGGANPFKNQLLLTLSSPSEAIYVRTPVRSVTVPGSEGAMTMTNGHSQTVARLKAGEIIVRKGETGDEVERFFLSDGFVLFKSPEDDSGCCTAEVLGVEVVPVSMLDKESAATALQELLQQGAGATDEWTKARTLLGQELLSSVIRAAP
ncbi:putative ATP synthase [Toxoplasma gondii TgCatPRC2]|uniref:ATP synthase n=13 Tax=Toxoplasma gondii TaxID=5811 RepID=B6KEJ0_TOXGV|nr:ATP synthase, putative [Toxoplasma gondii ME49]6TMH_d Chain d, ATP synthase subunit delta [Toxoplasma gondii GT1]6TMJ_d2 Chain d2, ATP synthase subunit delta [Toxoplasma gondii GT1]6TMK_d1 Chain d1, ATP synthase subunit delta [Toxoplasma gondii GT1]6TMK_d2 Chain d2, ATP synthase subunit delta [Toxoplasma gondii GT1]6TML_d1 Chain d1, ATP synthase subunit delta [Toxoplasma gondii GT1]6TML_d2 Chain d2, ATP synthase subunit delta [Toxoplasma gondii GT1]6TML_d3 Chain d3, ATP synthase subunit d|eukprot:XP_008881975.1 ATP synthase, putative [Hammondia hammondi]